MMVKRLLFMSIDFLSSLLICPVPREGTGIPADIDPLAGSA
jgi:hypothetical protein